MPRPRRNPLAKLPAAQKMRELPAEARQALRALVSEIGSDARKKAALLRRDRAREAREAARWLELAAYAKFISGLLAANAPGRLEESVIGAIALGPKTVSEIMAETKLSKPECYEVLNRLIAAGRVIGDAGLFIAASAVVSA